MDAVELDQISQQERPRLTGLAYRMTGSLSDAEDIVQDALLRAHRAPVDDIESPAAYLTTITTRLAIDHLRAKRTEPLDPDSLREAEKALWVTAATQPGDEAAPSELRESLAGLPDDQRRALLLAALFGFTAREIGEIESIPLGTAKTRIRTATMKLAAEQEEPR